MGSSLSCLCPELASNKTQVLVVTQNGELLKFTQGTRVKDVVISYPDHKVIPCQSSDRWALPDACQLSSRRLYFLVLEEAVADDAMFESLVWAAVAGGLMVVPEGVNKGGHRRRPLPLPESGCSGFDSGGEMVVLGQVLGLEDFGFKKLPWKPILQTIPEVISPPFHAAVFK